MAKSYLNDQLARDVEAEGVVEFSPRGDEPRLNAWLDVECETPWGTEVINYMLVNGAYVRSHVFVDYVEGGHFYRYGWIAEPQVWLEDVMSVVDQVCTGVHETHERFRMKYRGMNYEKSHASACVIERKLRSLLLDPETILPPAQDLARIFAAEGSGDDCYDLAVELFHKSDRHAKEANEQANNSVGKQEF